MVVRVLGAGDSRSFGEIVHVPGVGMCRVCDDAQPATAAQLTSWLAAARGAVQAAGLVAPRLGSVLPSPDAHVYLALDANGKVVTQVTAS